MLLIFDPQQAKMTGINVQFWHYGFQILLALTIVAALHAVGMILSVALLIIPGASALLVTKQFSRMIILSSMIATGCSFFGVYLSFYLDSSPAATIVLLMALICCSLFCFKLYADKKLVRSELAGIPH